MPTAKYESVVTEQEDDEPTPIELVSQDEEPTQIEPSSNDEEHTQIQLISKYEKTSQIESITQVEEPLHIERSSKNNHPVILGKWSRVITALVHVVPVAITAVLLSLYFSRVFWFPATGVSVSNYIYEDLVESLASIDNILNMLQLAAKLHEIFIVASLSAVTLKIFKRQLVGRGLPLGLLTGGYRVGDLKYLISHPFRSALTLSWPDALLCLFLALITLVGTLVGPASAVLMVPSLGWFPLREPFTEITMPVLYGSLANETWPLNITGELFTKTPECATIQGFYDYQCPGAGFSNIWNWCTGWGSAVFNSSLTFQAPGSSTRRRMLIDTKFLGATFSTTVSMASLLTVGRFLSYINTWEVGPISHTPKFMIQTSSSQRHSIFQPLVQTKCNAFDGANFNESIPIAFPSGSLNCYGDERCMALIDGNWVWPNVTPPASPDKERPTMSWAGPETNETHVLAVRFRLPYLRQGNFSVWHVSCAFMAHWVPSSLVLSPSESDELRSNVTDLSVFYTDSSRLVGPAIRLDQSWVKYLNPRQNITTMGPDGVNVTQEITAVGQLFRELFAQDPKSNITIFQPGSGFEVSSDSISRFFQMVMGAVVAEGLARTRADQLSYVKLHENDTSLVLDDINYQGGWGVPNVTYEWSDPNGPIEATKFNQSSETLNHTGTATEYFDLLQSFDFEVEQFGYGSGMPGPTTRFAIAVMFIYLGILVFYFVCTMIRRVKTVVSWDDMQDLLILAWNSPPDPKLDRPGVGVRKKKSKGIWRVEARVKADATGRVQLVGEEVLGLTKLRRNVRYN